MLGLDASCLEDWGEVKRAYRAAALESHPDKNMGGSEAEAERIAARFRAVQEAYEHLSKLRSDKKKKQADAE